MAKRSGRRRKPRARDQRRNAKLVFGRRNYVLLLIGVAVIVAGYVMMRIENEVDGFISLYVAPLLILGGYLEIIYAIIVSPDAEPEAAETQNA